MQDGKSKNIFFQRKKEKQEYNQEKKKILTLKGLNAIYIHVKQRRLTTVFAVSITDLLYIFHCFFLFFLSHFWPSKGVRKLKELTVLKSQEIKIRLDNKASIDQCNSALPFTNQAIAILGSIPSVVNCSITSNPSFFLSKIL